MLKVTCHSKNDTIVCRARTFCVVVAVFICLPPREGAMANERAAIGCGAFSEKAYPVATSCQDQPDVVLDGDLSHSHIIHGCTTGSGSIPTALEISKATILLIEVWSVLIREIDISGRNAALLGRSNLAPMLCQPCVQLYRAMSNISVLQLHALRA
jgi:hypothetical protein